MEAGRDAGRSRTPSNELLSPKAAKSRAVLKLGDDSLV